jgi:hypothetical protein
MDKRLFIFLLAFCPFYFTHGQTAPDAWMLSQLGPIKWTQTYEGVLADYHPVTVVLATDHQLIAGYLIHKGDNRMHRLLGDWTKKDLIQLQERDEYDRLTGYLRGSLTDDQAHLEWMSSDQTRMFDIIAYPKSVIRIRNFKAVAEWIAVDAEPGIMISVQKMDYGIVSGIALRDGRYSRFEGYCLDGTCSIWNTVLQNPEGAPVRIQMRQRDAKNYKVMVDGKEYHAIISATLPLGIRQFDNSMGFLDFIFPKLESKAFETWMNNWIDKMWASGVTHLTAINQPGNSGRLVHRSSGWVELFEVNEDFISGLITYINPGSIRRESFLWLRREDVVMSHSDLLNTPGDLQDVSSKCLKAASHGDDKDFFNWLTGTGYDYMVPTSKGMVMITEFNMIYGDDMQLVSLDSSKAAIKKKYWKLFGW